MTDPTYPLELLRAELKSAMNEQLVTLIDRFASKRDLQDFRADFSQHMLEDEHQFREINQKLDKLLAERVRAEGVSEERSKRARRKDRWMGALVSLVAALIGAAATLAALALSH